MRGITLLAVSVVVAAVFAGTIGASDTRGPACTNITFGNFGYNQTTGEFSGYETLAAPSCTDYELDIYDASGTTLLKHLNGTLDPTDPSMMTITFATTLDAGLDAVCIVGTSNWSGHIADRAPDSGCFFVDPTSSGGGGGFQ